MSTPVLTNLRQSLPETKTEGLVPRYVAPLFEEHPHVDVAWLLPNSWHTPVYIGVDYPLDVLAGSVLGIVVALPPRLPNPPVPRP
jgi:hypothetical protein